MTRKCQRTLAAIFAHPTSANLSWKDIEALFKELADASTFDPRGHFTEEAQHAG